MKALTAASAALLLAAATLTLASPAEAAPVPPVPVPATSGPIIPGPIVPGITPRLPAIGPMRPGDIVIRSYPSPLRCLLDLTHPVPGPMMQRLCVQDTHGTVYMVYRPGLPVPPYSPHPPFPTRWTPPAPSAGPVPTTYATM